MAQLQSTGVTGSLGVTGTITAQTLVVQTVTSSISVMTGSTEFGSLSTNTHRFTGSVNISGSLNEVGLVSITGTPASDGGQLGAELLSSTGWVSGSAWTGTFASGFTHVVGNTTPLTNPLAAVNGTYYYISYTVTGRTAGSFTIAFGGYTSGNITTTGTVGPRATSTGTLSVTPTTDFDGTVVLSIKVITASVGSIQLRNSSGTITNEIRNDSSNTNMFIGIGAGSRNIGGLRNTAIGTNALTSLTVNQSDSTAVGCNALSNTNSGQNTAVGAGAAANLLGTGTVAIGYNSATNHTSGQYVSIGWRAALSKTSGIYWVAIGREAAFSNTNGNSITAVGDVAGWSNTTGESWVSIGQSSGYNNATGSNWIAIGQTAARNYADGTSAATSFSDGVYIGTGTRVGAAGASNEVVIGYQAIGLGSNTTVIGNSSTTTTWLGGNLLLGSTTSSGDRLYVSGSARITNGLQVTGSVNISGSLSEVGLVTIRGTTATDTATSGSEQLSSTDWVSGSEWTGDFTAGFTHVVGNTVALTNSLAAVNGITYQIALTVTGRTAGSFSVTFGGLLAGNVTNISSTNTYFLRAASTGTLSITPTSDFDGTVVISIRLINNSSALVTLQTSGGSNRIEMRGFVDGSSTLIGLNSGAKLISSGINNTVLGAGALTGGVNANRNVAIGNNALNFAPSVNQTIAIGESAGTAFIGGVLGVAIGWQAASTLTTGANVVAIGWRSGRLNTIGQSWTAVGQSAGGANSVGSNWTALGAIAGGSNISGSEWTALGSNAGNTNITGSNWIAVGRNASLFYADGTDATSFSNGVYLGHSTRVGSASAANEIVIGYQAIGLGSNRTVIGNSSTTDTWLGGNLLVGTTTGSGYRAEISGSAQSGSLNVNNTLYVSGSRVGIGRSNPQYPLDVSGSMRIGPDTDVADQGELLRLSVGSSGGSTAFIAFRRVAGANTSYNIGFFGTNFFSVRRNGDVADIISIQATGVTGSLVPISIGASNGQQNTRTSFYLNSSSQYTAPIRIANNTTLPFGTYLPFISVNTTGTEYEYAKITGIKPATFAGSAVVGGLQFSIKSGSDSWINAFDITFDSRFLMTGSLDVSGSGRFTNNLTVTGSLSVTGSVISSGSLTMGDLFTLATRDPLPTSNVPSASLLASGSGADLKPYFWNGASWTALF